MPANPCRGRTRGQGVKGRSEAPWYGLMPTAALLAPLAVLLGQVLERDDLAVVPVMTTLGVPPSTVHRLPSTNYLSPPR